MSRRVAMAHDCRDPEALAAFWCTLLGYRVREQWFDAMGQLRRGRGWDRMTIARDRDDYWLAFGPTNVAIHRVWLVTEIGNPSNALTHAEHGQRRGRPSRSAERGTASSTTTASAIR
ncbi:MAG TPA: VOC family protein [Pseudonocardiaceae bacterium]|nr:VOC family protein [Pseudonocardiaceae bacterium]